MFSNVVHKFLQASCSSSKGLYKYMALLCCICYKCFNLSSRLAKKRENNNTLLNDTIHNSYNLWVGRKTCPRQCELSFSLNISLPHPLLLFLLVSKKSLFPNNAYNYWFCIASFLPQNNIIIKLYYCFQNFPSIESSPSTRKVL